MTDPVPKAIVVVGLSDPFDPTVADPPVPVASPPEGCTEGNGTGTLALPLAEEDFVGFSHGMMTVWTWLIKLSLNFLNSFDPSLLDLNVLSLASMALLRR